MTIPRSDRRIDDPTRIGGDKTPSRPRLRQPDSLPRIMPACKQNEKGIAAIANP